MTRIIAGRAKGMSLQVPARGTRPTSDRVRESLFSILQNEDVLDGSNVLDLFAGSGALSFEALSRGATEADVVDIAAGAAQTLNKNAQLFMTRYPENVIRVHKRKASAFLEAAHEERMWDLVFLDPPYDLANAQMSKLLEGLIPHLSKQSLVVVEQSSHHPFGSREDLYEVELSKPYGDTLITLLSPLRTGR